MILQLKDLKIHFKTEDGLAKAVDGVNFEIEKSETVARVGESGCGKSLTAKAIIGILNSKNAEISGEINFEGQNLLKLKDSELRKIRGKEISMIFQEPMTSLNPALKVGYQIDEIYRRHFNLSKKEAREKSIEMIAKVEIPSAKNIYKAYPHELSGGMRQRIMIAMALASDPKILIADEPTTALDVTIQAEVLKLMMNLKKSMETSILFITHDLGVVAEIADRVLVMYAGKIIEKAKVEELFRNPLHPYTKGLLKSRPLIGQEQKELFNIEGSVPSPVDFKENCRFSDRCPFVMEKCKVKEPRPIEKDGHEVSCYLYGDKNE